MSPSVGRKAPSGRPVFAIHASIFEVVPEWSEIDVFRLHGLLLEKSLHDLFDLRVSSATRKEILEWMQAPKEGVEAFSFYVCCQMFGIVAEEIREQVLQRYWRIRSH
jgi:hypothetical protein